ncbi:MAG: hypothetical protein ACRDD7_12185 [Peptostreptococcaceae bacterium]
MELILGVGLLALFGKKIISTVKSIATFFIIVIMSVVLTFMYSISYISSLSICMILKYGIKDFLIAIKNVSKSFIISKYRYKYRDLEKLVNILINCNYLVFILLSYFFIVKELIEPYITFNKIEAISLGVVVVALNRILRIVIDKIFNKKLKYSK